MTDRKALANRLRENWSNADILKAADMLEPAETLQHDELEAARDVVSGLVMTACFWAGVAVGVIGWSLWK